MPIDSKYLFNIDKITIDIEEVQLPFCYCYYTNINLDNNKYICDKFFIITSSFQINMFSKSSQIFFFDATFKNCPKSLYQLFNIAGYFKDIDGLIPLMFISLTNKSEILYIKVLNYVVNILKTFIIDLKLLTNQLMSDFE